MNPTTVEELKEILATIDWGDNRQSDVEKDLITKDRDIAAEFLRGDHDTKMVYIDSMTPELRMAITDVDAFRRYLNNFNNFGPCTAELQLWIDNEVKKRGLVDFKFTARKLRGTTKDIVEAYAFELLQMLKAPDVPDTELI